MKTVQLKRLASIRVSNLDKTSHEGDMAVRLCNYTDVYYRETITPDLDLMPATATPEEVRRFHLDGDDIVITKDSETPEDIGVPAFVARTAPDLVCGYHLAIIRPDQTRLHGRFLYWAMASQDVRDALTTSATGVTRFGLRVESIGAVCVPQPPLAVQSAIANYLDTETARIDALITKKRRLMDLLEERAAAQAVQLVLCDHGHAGPPSPSGLYRIVPADWAETQLRHLDCEVQTGPFGSQLHAEEYVDDRWPVVNPMNLVDGRIVAISSMTVSDNKRAELSRHILQAGDIVFGRRGEMGRAGLVTGDHSGWVCGTGSLRLRVAGRGLMPAYLALLLSTPPARAYFQLASVGSTMDNLNSEIVLAFSVLVPDDGEQARIVDEVERVRSVFNALRIRLTRQIDLLTERRQALITAAVTGEVDVPEAAA